MTKFVFAKPTNTKPNHAKSIYNKYDVPDEIDAICKSVDYEASLVGHLSWLPIGNNLWRSIINEEELKLLKRGQTILDMGSGSGSSAVQFAARGYDVIGVEHNSELIEISKRAVSYHEDVFKHFKSQRPIFLEGSYYPKEYIQRRKNGHNNSESTKKNGIVSKLESEYSNHFNSDKLHLHSEKDVYKEHNIDLSKIDVFYAYAWSVQTPSVIDVFKEYSRKDALLMLFGPQCDDIAKKMGLKDIEGSKCFRK